MIRIVALCFTGAIALSFAIGATVALINGELVVAGVFGTLLGAPAIVIYDLVKRGDGGSIPPAAKVILVGSLAAAASGLMQGCAGMQRTACSIWDGTHTVACRLCEQTEGGCPFGPEQGHAHEPGEPQ